MPFNGALLCKILVLLDLIALITSSSLGTLNTCCGTQLLYKDGQCEQRDVGEEAELFRNFTSKFTLKERRPDCKGAEVTFSVSDLGFEDDQEADDDDLTVITKNGYFRHNRIYYGADEYCLESGTEQTLLFRACKPTCSPQNPCLPKCCPPGQVLDVFNSLIKGQACVEDTTLHWSPVYFKDVERDLFTEVRTTFSLKRTRDWRGNPSCNKTVVYSNKLTFGIKFKILEDGTVRVLSKGNEFSWKWKPLNGEHFCIDGGVNFGPVGSKNGTIFQEDDAVIFYCLPNEDVGKEPDLGMVYIEQLTINYPNFIYTTSAVYYSAMMVSSFFLLLTIAVYLLLWETHTLHGWTLLSYFVSLLLMNLTMTAVYIWSGRAVITGNNTVISTGCQLIAVLGHFYFISAFSWMTCINFDLWLKFRSFRSTILPSGGYKRYMAYFTFATLVPAAIVALGLCFDLAYGDDQPRSLILPHYGKTKCFLDSRSIFPYLYAPVAMLLILNLVLFTITIVSIHRIKESTRVAACRASTRHQSPYLILKLTLAMGIPWTLELIAWAIELEKGDDGGNSVAWYLMILNLFNILQGIVIFLIFVWKRDILNSLRLKYPAVGRLCQLMPKSWKLNGNEGQQNGANKSSLQSNNTTSSRISSRTSTLSEIPIGAIMTEGQRTEAS